MRFGDVAAAASAANVAATNVAAARMTQ